MATFDASSEKVGNAFNIDTNISLMNSLACHTEKALYSPGAPVSSSTTTWVTTASKTATFASDEVLVMFGTVYFSISNGVNTLGRFSIFVNGSLYENDLAISCGGSGVGGNSDSRTIIKVGQFAGSVTVDLRFSFNTGSGTVYVSFASLDILAFKYRPS